METEITLLSAGIDIGTTTTQVVFSRLRLQTNAAFGRLPSLSITDRTILYESPVHLTPLAHENSNDADSRTDSIEVDSVTDSTGAEYETDSTDTESVTDFVNEKSATNFIDAEAVAALVEEDFRKAGILPVEVETGAVIITGESARKRNAGQVLHAISALAGDFVAAEAGPDLESILAGRGAGADRLSEKTGRTVLNIDIGGGTSNLCLFQNGRPIACSACNIGARAFRTSFDISAAEDLCGRLAEALASIAGLAPMSSFAESLLLPDEKEIPIRPDIISFSGGVAACMAEDEEHSERTENRENPERPEDQENSAKTENQNNPDEPENRTKIEKQEKPENQKKSEADLFPYGDLGLLLARAIRKNPHFTSAETICGRETVRATVTGAASFSMEISGNTVFCRDISFPLKNVPVFSMSYAGKESVSALSAELCRIRDFADQMQQKAFGVAIKGTFVPSFQEVEALADTIAAAFAGKRTKQEMQTAIEKNQQIDPEDSVRKGMQADQKDSVENSESSIQDNQERISGGPILILLESDFAKALGLALKRRIKTGPILCLDGIAAEDGCYIDVGAPLSGGLAYPVTVKTLIFG